MAFLTTAHYHSLLLTFFNDIINCLNDSSKHMLSNSKNYKIKPGWTDYVSDIYKHTRELRSM